MWNINVVGDVAVETRSNMWEAKQADIRGSVRNKADVYKLVDKLCEALGIPDPEASLL